MNAVLEKGEGDARYLASEVLEADVRKQENYVTDPCMVALIYCFV